MAALEAQGSALFMEQKDVQLEGWVKKKSPKGLFGKPWQKRYFVLYDDLLFYYKEKPATGQAQATSPAGTIPLEIVQSIEAQPSKKPNGCRFDIKLKGDSASSRIFELCTEDDSECNMWVKRLKELRGAIGTEARPALDADATGDGKVWKNTAAIRQHRARSSIAFGNQRYLIQEEPRPRGSSEEEEPSSVGDDVKDHHGYGDAGASLELEKELEKDHFGQIHSVRDKHTKALYLLHVFLKNNPDLQEAVRLFDAMAKLKHPYIFQQVHRGSTSDAVVAVYSYALEQSLFVHLTKQRRFPEQVVRVLSAEVILALAYLHEQGLAFRNMRAETIFLDSEGHAVVSDFLLALPLHKTPKTNETPEYHTPERLKGALDDGLTGDWWRLGVLLYELLVGIPPFRRKKGEGVEALHERIIAHPAEPLRFPPFVSQDAQDLINALLTTDPEQRLGVLPGGAADVMKHPFFASINWKLLQQRRVQSPDWIDETLMAGRRTAAESKRALDPTKKFIVEVEVLEAKGLPGLKADGQMSDPFCTVSLAGNDPFHTGVVPNTITPRWTDAKAQFNVVGSLNEDIHVSIFHREAKANTPIGDVKFALTKARAGREGDVWLPIVGRDGMAHGEVRIAYTWLENVEMRQLLPPTETNTTFKHHFGGEKAQDIMNQDNDVFSDL